MPQQVSTIPYRLRAVLVVAAALARPAWGGCSDLYPDSQVAARLEQPEYAACTLQRMGADYADILKEQARLLGLLRAGYERKLKGELDEQQVRIRLDEFDAKVADTVTLAKAFASPSNVPEKGVAPKAPAGEPRLPSVLRQSRQQSEALRVRIAHARDKLNADEAATYCKLDFSFRVGDGLNGKMRRCLN